jgi:hypothetical protein
MRYLIACLAACFLLGGIYLLDWGARSAFATMIRARGGDPTDPHLQIEVPSRVQTLGALERLVFGLRFVLAALALAAFLGIAAYTKRGRSN